MSNAGFGFLFEMVLDVHTTNDHSEIIVDDVDAHTPPGALLVRTLHSLFLKTNIRHGSRARSHPYVTGGSRSIHAR